MGVDLVWIISASVFLMAMLVSSGLYAHLVTRESVTVRRRLAPSSTPGTVTSEPHWIESGKQWLGKLLTRLGEFSRPSDTGEVSAVRQELLAAGFRHERAVLIFFGAKLVAALGGIGVVALIPSTVWGFPSAWTMIGIYVAGAILGYFLPVLWLRLAAHRRKGKLLAAVPDALDLLVICVEAGLGLDMAIARVGDEIGSSCKELGEEFQVLTLELRTGLHRTEALRNFARRTDLEEVRTLVALLVQTDRFGTSIGQALRVHSETMRTTRQMKAEELAAKLPVKLLFPLIFFILPSLFIAILGPAIIKIMRVLFPIMQG